MASRPLIAKSVAIHRQRDGRVFFLPYSETENGFDVFDGLPEVSESLEDAAALGRSLEAALARSNARILPAVNLRAPDPDNEILRWTQNASWGEYMRGVKSVSVSIKGGAPAGELKLRPLQNKGARGGFVAVPGASFELSYSSPEELGRAVQEAMAKAI